MLTLRDLNGNHPLPGFDHRITWSDGIKSEDQSGNTSDSSDSYQGFKPVMIDVRLKIKYGDDEAFKSLYNLFHATDDGEPRTYILVHSALNLWKVHKCRFHDSLRISEEDQLKVYSITFMLKQADPTQAKIERKTSNTAGVVPYGDV